MSEDLTNKIVVLTGGSQGIGLTVAKHYLLAGARVALLGRSAAKLEDAVHELGTERVVPYPVDVTDRAAVQSAADAIEKEMGPINIWHNNAGIHRGFGPFWEMSGEEWDADLSVNLTGAYNGARAVAPFMIGRKSGIIINTLGGGVKNIPSHMAAYSVSKTGLLKLTQIMAQELKEHGVAVFGIFPGLIDTPGNREKISRGVVRKWTNLEEALKKTETTADPAGELCVKLASGKYNTLSGKALQQGEDPAGHI